MKESAQAALSYLRRTPTPWESIRTCWTSPTFTCTTGRGHPKEGPSAGVALTTALASLLTGRAVRAAWP